MGVKIGLGKRWLGMSKVCCAWDFQSLLNEKTKIHFQEASTFKTLSCIYHEPEKELLCQDWEKLEGHFQIPKDMGEPRKWSSILPNDKAEKPSMKTDMLHQTCNTYVTTKFNYRLPSFVWK